MTDLEKREEAATTLLEYSEVKEKITGLQRDAARFISNMRQLADTLTADLDSVTISRSGERPTFQLPSHIQGSREEFDLDSAQFARNLDELRNLTAQRELLKKKLHEIGQGNMATD